MLAEAVRVPGAAHIWFSHNHPSGRAELSRSDENLNQTLADAFKGSGIEPMGLMAVTGSRFTHVSANGNAQETGAIAAPTDTAPAVPVVEREMGPKNAPRPALRDPAEAKTEAAFYYQRQGGPGLLLLNAQHQPVAWVPIGNQMAGKLRGTGGLNAIYRAVSESNAHSAVIVHGGELDATVEGGGRGQTISGNIANALDRADVRALDSINVKTGASAAESGGVVRGNDVLFSKSGGANPYQNDLFGNPMRSFAGARAESADRLSLTSAQEQIDAGEDAEAVRKATGWHQGADGKWRFEISDADARLKPKAFEGQGRLARASAWLRDVHGIDQDVTSSKVSDELRKAATDYADNHPGGRFLADVLEHPALFAAYPALARLRVVLGADAAHHGTYSSTEHTIELSLGRIDAGRGDGQVLSTLLHEVQHAIQTIEGFATGGNAASPGYRRLAGEVEARNTQTRQKMSDAARRGMRPDATADVPASDVIVTFNSEEMDNAPAPANAAQPDRAAARPAPKTPIT